MTKEIIFQCLNKELIGGNTEEENYLTLTGYLLNPLNEDKMANYQIRLEDPSTDLIQNLLEGFRSQGFINAEFTLTMKFGEEKDG